MLLKVQGYTRRAISYVSVKFLPTFRRLAHTSESF